MPVVASGVASVGKLVVKEKIGGKSGKVTNLASYYEYKALKRQGYNASEAYGLMKQFRSGKNPNSAFAFHFTTLKGGKGITDSRQIIGSNTGVRGAGVYAGRTPKPSWLLKHLPWSGWVLGHTPVRIEGNMNGRKLNYPLKSMKFDCKSLKYQEDVMNKKRDYTMLYAIINFLCFIIIYAVSIMFFFSFIDIVIIRIIVTIILYFICSFIEKKLLMQYLNYIVMFLFPKEIRKKEKELINQIKKESSMKKK